MTKRQLHEKTYAVLRTVGVILFWILFWWGCAALYAKPAIFPTPIGVFKAFLFMLKDAQMYLSIGNSLLHVLSGLLMGSVIGVLFGVLIARFEIAHAFLAPAFSVARSTPVVCFILLAWVFLGSQVLPAFVSAVMVAPVMLNATAGAIREIDPRLKEVATVYRLPFGKRIKSIYLPAVLPAVRISLITCVGLAWKSCVAAEMIAFSNHTVGYGIWFARTTTMDYDTVFAWTIIIVTISILFEKITKAILTPKKRGAQ